MENDLISRYDAIRTYQDVCYGIACDECKAKEEDGTCRLVKWVRTLPTAQPEKLTDKEQRIFLAAMGREENVCKQVDEECRNCREPYEDSLVWVCHEIIRKVKAALWEI